jgi:type I restriction enzyme M protein
MNSASFQEISGFLWSIADSVLRDDFKRGKYPDVILPFTVLRRLDCVLAPSKPRVLKRYADLHGKLENLEGQLRRASGHSFYNVSPFDFEKLLDDPKNIAKNLRAYINGFSENMKDVIDKFKLRNTIGTLDEKGLLFMLVRKCKSNGCVSTAPLSSPPRSPAKSM